MKNMKRFTKTVALIVSMVGFGDMAFAQQCKIAIVNMQETIVGSNEGKAASAKFDARVKEWKQQISAVQREIDIAQRKLNGQSTRIPEETKAVLNTTIQEKAAELNRIRLAATKDVDDYREPLLASIKKAATEIAKEVAAERGIDSVMDSSSPSASFPVNADATNCDITAEVKARMNAKFSPADPAK
jgi:Skp family chaperone for outer membrane proteins